MTKGNRVLSRMKKRLTYANVMSTIAVFVALGGSSYAAFSISGSSIKNRSIPAKKIFIGFDFHPEFAKNGLFYTVHSERAPGNPATPNFVPPGFTAADATYHNVITEWHATNPAANTFDGTRRELLRVAHVVANLTHPYGYVDFNPTAKPGTADYGLLYTSGSDLGFSNGGGPNASNPARRSGSIRSSAAILRIDPRSPALSEARRASATTRFRLPTVCRRRRREDARRDLCLRIPERAPAFVGSHRWDDVRLRYRHEQRRRGQHRSQRRQLRLDEARGHL